MDTTDPRLIEAAQRFLGAEAARQQLSPDDRDAWHRFEAKYSPIIAEFCRKQGLNGSEIDELVQEVWVRVWRNLPRFEYAGRKGSFRGWISVLTRRAAVTKHREDERRTRRERPLSGRILRQLDDEGPSLYDRWTKELERELARSEIERMEREADARIRYFGELLRLYYWEQCSAAELAVRFGKSENHLRKDLVRARLAYFRRIRGQLGDD